MMDIVLHPDARLTTKCTELPPREDWPVLAWDMIAHLRYYNGQGLAAPQLGLMYRMFAIKLLNGGDTCVFDPVILGSSFKPKEQITLVEECLSLPNVFVRVQRPWSCKVRFLDALGEEHILCLNGMQARVWHHETDHIDGITILQRGAPLELVG